MYQNSDGKGYFQRYQYNYLRDQYRQGNRTQEELSALAAIGAGIYNACLEYEGVGIVVIGVTEDKGGTVDDDASELSYRCVYRVFE